MIQDKRVQKHLLMGNIWTGENIGEPPQPRSLGSLLPVPTEREWEKEPGNEVIPPFRDG